MLERMTIKEITPQEAGPLLESGWQLIDVREPDEYAEVHAEGALNIPLSELAERWQEVDRDRPAVMICRSGARSMRAAEFLAGQGFSEDQLANLGGGTNEWVAQGLPHGPQGG